MDVHLFQSLANLIGLYSTGVLELGFVRKLHAALGPHHKDNLKVG